MFYSDLTLKAAQISFEAHINQQDKSDYPYFMHPMTLALQFNDEESVCVALLHDVIEDHPENYSFEYLEQQGFPKSIVDAIRLLTHDPKVDYLDYVRAIKDNPIARRVKIADLKHNMDTRRGGGVKPPKYDLYQEALKILEE